MWSCSSGATAAPSGQMLRSWITVAAQMQYPACLDMGTEVNGGHWCWLDREERLRGGSWCLASSTAAASGPERSPPSVCLCGCESYWRCAFLIGQKQTCDWLSDVALCRVYCYHLHPVIQGGELERIDLHKSVGDVFVDSFLEQLFDDLIDFQHPLRSGDGKRQLPNLFKTCF